MNVYTRILFVVSLLFWTISESYGQDTSLENCVGYVIGEFNDWKLPEEGNLQGAIQMQYSRHVYNGADYTDIPGLEGGGFIPENCKFAIYIPDGEYKGFYHDGTYSATTYYTGKVCTINFGIAEGNRFSPLMQDTFREMLKSETLIKEFAFETRGWNGGILYFYFPFKSDEWSIFKETYLMIYTSNPWIIKGLSEEKYLYHQYGWDDYKSKMYKMYTNFLAWGNYTPREYTRYNEKYYFHSELSVLYSLDKNSYEEGSEQTIGAVYPDTVVLNLGDQFIIPLMRGGYPIKFKINSGEVLDYNVNLRQWLIEGYVRDRTDSEKKEED